jgi:hypothetical protein
VLNTPPARGLVIAAVAATILLSTTSGASAESLVDSGTGSSSNSTGTILVGSGQIDVSQLTIVGIIDPATGEITDIAPMHPAPTAPSATASRLITPFITHPACAGRTDFYRLIDTSGYQQCFANTGVYTLTSGYWVNTQYLCPGNNYGRTEYLNGTINTWSLWRGPELVYSTCYQFAYPVPAFAVQIS